MKALRRFGLGLMSLMVLSAQAANPYDNPDTIVVARDGTGQFRDIDEAIEASWHTCERCGATEGVTTNLDGYRLTLCPECRQKIKPREIVKHRIELHRINTTKI